MFLRPAAYLSAQKPWLKVYLPGLDGLDAQGLQHSNDVFADKDIIGVGQQWFVDGKMRNGKELTHDLIRKQKGSEFSLKFFLQKENTGWKNIFTTLKLVKKGTRKEVNYDYGDYTLGEKLLTIQEGLEVISSLFQEDDEKRKLAIPDHDEFAVRLRDQFRFVPSKQRYGLLKDEWPMRFCKFEVLQDKKGTSGESELLKEGFPYYPRVGDAVVNFFKLAVEHFSSYGAVYVALIDYRARIESLKLSFSKAELKLDSPEINFKDLVVKVFAKSGSKVVTFPDIYPKSDVVKIDLGFQPENMSVVLLSRQDNKKIDGKEFATWSQEGEGVFTERPKEEVLSLTRAGESQYLEYKYDVVNEGNKNDFIESIIAFLNTNSGIILVGVKDNGDIVGSQKSAEDIQKLIHASCDPPPKNIKIEEKKIGGNKVIVVEVPEGDDKPYQSKRDKNFYVRHNSSDMRMERSELLSILREKTEQSRSVGISY